VEVDDCPRGDIRQDPLDDHSAVGRLPIPGVDRPEHGRPESELLGKPIESPRVLAVGWADELRVWPDRARATTDLLLELVVVERSRMGVPEGMAAELVTLGARSLEDGLASGGRRADNEERPAGAVHRQPVEDRLRPLGRPIVEGQREERLREPGPAPDDHPLDPTIRAVVLSDRTIRRLIDEGRIEIDPYDESLLQPSSVDVRIDRFFRVFHNARYPYIDVKEPQEDLTELVEVKDDTPFILHPGEFVLASSLERIRLPDDLVARLEGKSSLGRLGLLIHSTAGFIDPGWDGHVTLELSNVANLPITIYYGMKIGQLSFVQLSEPAETPYGSGELGSKYQGQQGPTPSRYWQNFDRQRV
jgi:dCTP deaminase